MIKIAVVDDEVLIVDFIHKKISVVLDELKTEYEIYDFIDSKSALDNLLNSNFDIIFLDIDMPNISGMDIARKIRKHKEKTAIVFITNKDELVYDAIKYSPFRFIRKSKFESEIYEAVYKCVEKINNSKSTYMFSTLDGEKVIHVIEVRYVEVSSHKVYIHEVNKTLVMNGNLKDVEEIFFKFGFIKIHQSYIVNYRCINLIKRKEVILDDDSSLPLSRSRYESSKIEYMRLSREKW